MAREIFMCRASSSLSGIIGNVAYIVRDFVEGLFPPSFFKHVYIDTSMMQLAFEKEDVFKYNKPMLIIRPKVSLSDDTIYGRLPDWMSTNYFVFKQLEGNYTPVFADLEKEIYIYSVPDRLKLTFEIEIVASTKMQQINIGHYLKGSVLHRGYFYLNDSYIETEVPTYFIKTLANILNYDLRVPQQKSEFLNYLEKHSQSFVTEKIKASSGNPAYFYIYSTNLLSMFEDYPQLDDGEQKDQTMSNFRITETFTVDFSCPSNFFLETNSVLTPEQMEIDNETRMNLLGDTIALNYTMNFVPDKEIEVNGKKMKFIRKQGYITDNTTTLDELPLDDFFSEDVKDVIAYNNKYKIDNDEVFKINLYRESAEVNPANVNVIWSDLVLQNINPSPETTYHIYLYVDNERYVRTLNRIREIRGEVYND
jgi:hypothetical protein